MIERSEAEAMMVEERVLELAMVKAGVLAMLATVVPSMLDATLTEGGLDGVLSDQVGIELAKRLSEDPTVEALIESQLRLLQDQEAVRETRYRTLTVGGELRTIAGGRS